MQQQVDSGGGSLLPLNSHGPMKVGAFWALAQRQWYKIRVALHCYFLGDRHRAEALHTPEPSSWVMLLRQGLPRLRGTRWTRVSRTEGRRPPGVWVLAGKGIQASAFQSHPEPACALGKGKWGEKHPWAREMQERSLFFKACSLEQKSEAGCGLKAGSGVSCLPG